MSPSPRDVAALLRCPLCPPASLLAAPTTLRCGHTVCARHVAHNRCPIPACDTQEQRFTPSIPSTSRVAFFPVPLSTHDLPPLPASPPLDVRVNNIIHLLRPFRSDDDSDPEDPPHRHPTTSSPPPQDFAKALASELACEICFMLLRQPVTTPCQHTFCAQCLQRALDHSMLCPLCRQELPGFAYFQEHPYNKLILSLLLKAFPDDYASRAESLEREEHNARLDTPIFVCQLSFPGMPTLLHFFEPRYRLMLRRCLEKPHPTFGMIVPPRAAPIPGHGTNASSEFGTMLEIRSVQMLTDGRSMVETWGTHRFRILEQGSLDGYMIGRVERIDDYDDDLAEWAQDDHRAPLSSSSASTCIPLSPSLPARIARPTSPPPPPPPPPRPSPSPVSHTGSRGPPSPSAPSQFLSTPALMATCHAFLTQLRAGTAPWVVQRLNHTYGPQPPDSDPGAFSFWMGMVLPIDEHEKAKLLPVKSARLRLRVVVGWIQQLNSNWWFTSGCTVL